MEVMISTRFSRRFFVLLFQSELGFFAVVEMDDPVTDDLIALVPFAGDDDDVVVRSLADAAGDGFATVGQARVIARAAHAALDVVEDRFGLLAPWVVAGQDDAVRQARGDGAHLRALVLVAIAAAAE